MKEASLPDYPSTPPLTANPVTGEPFAEHDTVSFRVTRGMRLAVNSVAERLLGEGRFAAYRLMEGGGQPSDRLHDQAEIAALIRIQQMQEGLLHTAVAKARGAGTSWDRIGELMGLKDTPRGMSPGEHAFETLLPRESFHHPSLRFECSTCHESVIDRGPFETNPEDNEKGHAANCARFRAEIDRCQ